MAKLTKMYYTTLKGEKKINCYSCIIPKKIVEEAKFDEQIKYKAIAEKNRIVLIKEK